MAKEKKEKKEKKIKVKDNKKVVKKEKTNKEGFFKGVKKEMRLVKWPTFKDIVKYTISTVIFCLVLVVFFLLLSLLMSFIKGAF